VGLVALCALSFGITYVVANDDGDGNADADAATPSSTAVATDPEIKEARLTSASRLGYEGLGPIKLGMSIDDAERAGQAATANTGCALTFDPAPDTGLRYGDVHLFDDDVGAIVGLNVTTPAISTISGIHIGSTRDEVHRTYANAVDVDAETVRIENPQGRRITFYVGRNGIVSGMTLHASGPAPGINPLC